MKSSTYAHTNFKFDSQNSTNIIDAEFHSENLNKGKVVDLYYKYDDEPDFDCEFLSGISYDDNKNVIDLEFDEDLADDYKDNEWDVNIYDPYLESTYF